MTFAGPLDCGDSNFYLQASGRIDGSGIDCTALDTNVQERMLVSSQLMKMCQTEKDNAFEEGVHGHIEQLVSAFVVKCEHGNLYTWSSYGICCSGTFTHTQQMCT